MNIKLFKYSNSDTKQFRFTGNYSDLVRTGKLFDTNEVKYMRLLHNRRFAMQNKLIYILRSISHG